MILFIAALLIFLLSLAGIFLTIHFCEKDFMETFIGPICVLLFATSFVSGLVLIPLLRPYKVEYKEITNYQILKSNNAIVIDLTNSNAKMSDKLIKYNSYRAVTEFGDSTKVFEGIERGFYGDVLLRFYVWTNPPYNFYNRE